MATTKKSNQTEKVTTDQTKKVTREWTLMFYFASDNPLAPSVVAQLKALKQAGFHHDANVIAHFDPQTEETPTHIFDVNLINKLKNPDRPNIGFRGNDPFVRTLMEDKLWRDQTGRDGTKIRDSIKESLKGLLDGREYDPPIPPVDRIVRRSRKRRGSDEVSPIQSLEAFLNFCCDEYPAHHYMLFLLGHGMVVGNDIFLFDENAAEEQSVSLTQLALLLNTIKTEKMDAQKAKFELVGFHSCSVSSLEVAYELQGTANYMLASQGPAFVGSWPYRQILIRVFNDLQRRKETPEEKTARLKENRSRLDDKHVRRTINRIFDYCLFNSSDYVLAGYSFDIALCNLNRVTDIQPSLKELSSWLVKGLDEPLVMELLQLSHLKAQSYWQENYTDLFDFCLCLREQFEKYELSAGQMTGTLQAIHTAAGEVIKVLKKGTENDFDRLVARADFLGPAYQYSHGLSVYFPWVEPSDDNPIRKQYRDYKFNATGWGDFLGSDFSQGTTAAANSTVSAERRGYFRQTMRPTNKEEQLIRAARRKQRPTSGWGDGLEEEQLVPETPAFLLKEDVLSLVYNEEGQLSNENSLGGGKTSSIDPTGDDCACASIKNYPRDTRALREKGKHAVPERRKKGAGEAEPPRQSFAMSRPPLTSVESFE
jgi:hypothetical protein